MTLEVMIITERVSKYGSDIKQRISRISRILAKPVISNKQKSVESVKSVVFLLQLRGYELFESIAAQSPLQYLSLLVNDDGMGDAVDARG